MRILHLGKYYAPYEGGIENTMRALMTLQKGNGHQVSAIVHQHKVKDVDNCELDSGMPVYRMSIHGIFLFVPIALFAYFMIRKAIAKERPDVLHLHMPNVSCFWLLLMPTARKIPWVIHWHSDVVGEKPDWRIQVLYPLYRIFEQWSLKRATKVIVTSPNYLATSNPLTTWIDKCDVVPLGIDLNKELPIHKVRLCDTRGTLKVLCIGRLTYYKGHQYLINAISQVQKTGVKITLDIVGDGDLVSVLQKQVSHLGLADNVIFHGAVDENKLNDLITHCDLLSLPSIERTEAFGLVLLEAMQARKACIVTDVKGSGMSYVVEHLKTGLVVEHSSADALSDALIHCSVHPHHLIEWGRAGYERVKNNFSLQKGNAKIERIYHQVLALY